MDPLVILLSFLVILIISYILTTIRKVQGPWGLPIVGHALFLGQNPAKTLLEWKKHHGPVFHIQFFHKRALVLNDKQSIIECFSKPETSGRTSFPSIKWFLRRSGNGLLFTDGPHAEGQRNFLLQAFRKCGMARNKMGEIFLTESSKLVEKWRFENGRCFPLSGSTSEYVLNSIWSLVGSKSYNKEESAEILQDVGIISDADSWLSKLLYVIPGIINTFCDKLEKRLQVFDRLNTLQHDLAEEHKSSKVTNDPRDIFDMFLDKVEETTVEDSIFHASQNSIAPLFRDVLIATIETTSITIEWFILYVSKHKQVRVKLQEEIHKIIGPNRQPHIADKDSMPYTQACILETLRISSIVPLSIPHSALKDIEFRGVRVLEGTTILANLYAVHHDPDVWENPEEFRPERFLDKSGEIDKVVKANVMPFCAGKRACIGLSFVEDEIFMILVKIYQEFDISTESTLTSLRGKYGLTYRPPDGIKIAATPRKPDSSLSI